MRSVGLVVLAVFAIQLTGTLALAAELPVLGSPSTTSGNATRVAFYGGASADNGSTFKSSFSANDLLTITGRIHIEPFHVGAVGSLFVVAVIEGRLLVQSFNGQFYPWDGRLETLQATFIKTLRAREDLTIIDRKSLGSMGISSGNVTFFLGYSTEVKPGELYYSGTPIRISLSGQNTTDLQSAAFKVFTDTVSQPIIQNNCIACHSATGSAASSKLLYKTTLQPGYQNANFDVLLNYILNVPNGSSLILSKAQGISHGGGARLAAGSNEFNSWNAFVQASLKVGSGGQASNSQSILNSVGLMDNPGTLRKAALLFAGRIPTTTELQSVTGKGDAELRTAIRNLMQGTGFKQFLAEGANDHLLTLGLESYPYNVLNQYYYPQVGVLLSTTTGSSTQRRRTSAALAREPLELIAHVVMNERPYTDIVTANYIMVNPYSAPIYGGNVAFTNATDENEWREGRITEYYRCGNCGGSSVNSTYNIPTVYPHAGLLNSPMFLGRFPSTETNRNRARARWAYYFFLGVDIEGLSGRTTDPAALADTNNPTLKNPNCTACHNIMDPVAGAFQNYGDDGRYRDKPGGYDALPASYKRVSNRLYKVGDRWFADMLQPGFGELLAPPGSDESLQWLGQQMAKDGRFGYGAVNFWYPAVMGTHAMTAPENPEDSTFFAKNLAYSAEQSLMHGVAADFMAGAQGKGKFNLKDLLTDLAMSRHFRAVSTERLSIMQAVELEDIGAGRLLTPEQLNRKLQQAAGFNWAYGTTSSLGETYRLLYGGIDSNGIKTRVTNLTTLMRAVVTTMANETSCAIAAKDFAIPRAQRKLFTEVELTSLPTNSATAIRSNIQRLHSVLLGEELASNDSEITATYNLFNSVWQGRINIKKNATVSSSTEICLWENVQQAVSSDANQTLRAWAAVINYMLRDFKFIHE